jgi:hypothetical protein
MAGEPTEIITSLSQQGEDLMRSLFCCTISGLVLCTLSSIASGVDHGFLQSADGKTTTFPFDSYGEHTQGSFACTKKTLDEGGFAVLPDGRQVRKFQDAAHARAWALRSCRPAGFPAIPGLRQHRDSPDSPALNVVS